MCFWNILHFDSWLIFMAVEQTIRFKKNYKTFLTKKIRKSICWRKWGKLVESLVNWYNNRSISQFIWIFWHCFIAAIVFWIIWCAACSFAKAIHWTNWKGWSMVDFLFKRRKQWTFTYVEERAVNSTAHGSRC